MNSPTNTGEDGRDVAAVSGPEPTTAVSPEHAAAADAPRSARISRRGFVVGGVGCAALLALGAAGAYAFAGETLVRPPGGQDESRLLGACIKCDRCRSACPEGAIDVAHLEDGLVNARTPKMNFQRGYCTYCTDRGAPACIEACPTGALTASDSGSYIIGVAAVDTNECVLYRGVSGSCSKQCITACVYEAVSYTDTEGLVVDESRCNGCGACVLACPSASYRSYTGSGLRGINVQPVA